VNVGRWGYPPAGVVAKGTLLQQDVGKAGSEDANVVTKRKIGMGLAGRPKREGKNGKVPCQTEGDVNEVR
jgi:hypothetical protein